MTDEELKKRFDDIDDHVSLLGRLLCVSVIGIIAMLIGIIILIK